MKANLTSICLSLNTVTLNCTDNNYDIYLVNNMVRNNTNKNTLILKENSDNGWWATRKKVWNESLYL